MLSQVQAAAEAQFNGNLYLSWGEAPPWGLTFRHGRLAWAWASNHRLRRWRRLLGPEHRDVVAQSPRLGFASTTPVWEYETLRALVSTGQLGRGAALELMRQNMTEILFEIVQGLCTTGAAPQLRSQTFKLEQPLKFFSPSELFVDVAQAWGNWCQAQLQAYSPMAAPCLYQPEKLKALVSEASYQNLHQLLQGQYALRELAAVMNQNLLSLSQTLASYERRCLIRFQPLPEPLIRENCTGSLSSASPFSTNTFSASNSPALPTGSNRVSLPLAGSPASCPTPSHASNPLAVRASSQVPLVLCIDDSEIICQRLGKIVTAAGYRYASLCNPLMALQQVLETQPSLIFLDLIMPIIGGHELCGQIRRVSGLGKIPIVVLTSNDGLVERVRLKVAGSDGFLAKPICDDAILKVLARYCGAAAA
ncbi:MAG: response regulator [Synechococcales cyanobacterium RM1_1_8]|nr:response regulator [Synechococcales cyanobacterium RM1_1_8]